MGHDLLPTKDKIASMRQHDDRECFRCGDKRETLVHALKDYPNSKDVLIAGGLDGRIIDNNFANCIDWLEEAVRILDKKSMANFISILWNS